MYSFFCESVEELIGPKNENLLFIKFVGRYRVHFDKYINETSEPICPNKTQFTENSIANKYAFKYSPLIP
jgi:hypothetical protein